jgi:hypothetical protein
MFVRPEGGGISGRGACFCSCVCDWIGFSDSILVTGLEITDDASAGIAVGTGDTSGEPVDITGLMKK